MLDQNTDRMWYVIGAVIIGAAIVLILNGTVPDLFASVGKTFEDKTNETIEMVDGIGPTSVMFLPENLEPYKASVVHYDESSNTWTLDLEARPESNMFNTGFRTKPYAIDIPYGKTYTISYDVWSPVDISAVPDVNAGPVEGEWWRQHDNDDQSTRRYNGQQAIVGVDYADGYAPFKALPIKANTWTTITFSYANTSPENVNKVALYDYSDLGVKNDTGEVLRIKMRNISGHISD